MRPVASVPAKSVDSPMSARASRERYVHVESCRSLPLCKTTNDTVFPVNKTIRSSDCANFPQRGRRTWWWKELPLTGVSEVTISRDICSQPNLSSMINSIDDPSDRSAEATTFSYNGGTNSFSCRFYCRSSSPTDLAWGTGAQSGPETHQLCPT